MADLSFILIAVSVFWLLAARLLVPGLSHFPVLEAGRRATGCASRAYCACTVDSEKYICPAWDVLIGGVWAGSPDSDTRSKN
jgi:hypothetical protein